MRILFFYCMILSVALIFTAGAELNENGHASFTAAVGKNVALFDSAYNAWDEERFSQVNERFNRLASAWPERYLPHYWQGVVDFHLVSYTLFGMPEQRDKKAAKRHVENALDALGKALKMKPDDAESLALLGTVTGIKIFLAPLQAPVLGPRVMASMKSALAADSTNPRVLYLAGVSYYNTPALMGGGVDKGLPYLLKAEKRFAQEARQPHNPEIPHWGRSTCLGFIAKAYTKKKEYAQARKWYRKALTVNPSDKMAKMGLQDLDKMN